MATKQFNPFLDYSSQLQKLLVQASKQQNPALWLYNNKARTLFFMLEALTRLHANAFDESLFDKWNKRFKKMEDLFGQIDQFIVLQEQFKTNKKVSKDVIEYFENEKQSLVEKCNKRLLKKDWFDERLNKFDGNINKLEFKFDNAYVFQIKLALQKEINEILEFAETRNYNFTILEDEVHEMRRKLRWLSIYVQAFNGIIQFKSGANRKTAINYLTKEILQSPFNKIPKKPVGKSNLYYNAQSFYATSWIISELGKLKDKGLVLHDLQIAIGNASNLPNEQSFTKAIEILGYKKNIESLLLAEASGIVKKFIVNDKMLQSLIA